MEHRIVLASHGSLAEGMLSAVTMILTDQGDKVLAYGLDTYETPQNIKEQVLGEMAKKEAKYTIICDLKGGSVCNELLTLCGTENVNVIAGMNLGLVLSVLLSTENAEDMGQALKECVEESKEGIEYFDYSLLMENTGKEDDELW